MKIRIRIENDYNILFGENIETGIFIFYNELTHDKLLNVAMLPNRYI